MVRMYVVVWCMYVDVCMRVGVRMYVGVCMRVAVYIYIDVCIHRVRAILVCIL